MKVLVIGSGPIVIGQAAEFDYAGTQACRSLREEGCEVVLINSNPATIMTDPELADALYIEPLTPEFCERIIARERPDALLPTLGGQTGLNLATKIAELGILEKYDVRLLGTPLSAIRKAEDREEFRKLMREIREPVPESFIIETQDQLRAILDTKVPDEGGRLIDFTYPRIVRPAYTLGGTGGGIAHDPDELWEIGRKGLALSMRSQVMVERSLLGWKEIEYEVMRDRVGNCITVCNMENFDPMGVHTGDSIVVAPSQTLSDLEYHMLRTASLKIIRALGIEGGCNVQLAVNPESFDYYVIEVNPRVSRSSALASKATGYPIARVAAKIAIGKTLDQIENQVTKTTKACFEPALDYCVVKIPRWPFDKFRSGDRTLFTQMKATGEVMAIDRSFEAALLKAIRGMEVKQKDLRHERFSRRSIGCQPMQSGADKGKSTARNAAERSIGGQPMQPSAQGQDARGAGTGGIVPEIAETAAVEKRQGAHLPHWRLEGAIYNVVFRQADSVPREVAQRWKEERDILERRNSGSSLAKDEYDRLKLLQSDQIDAYLNAGKGSCVLRDTNCARTVRDCLLHFDGQRYLVHAWCVMPNHVHVVLEPLEGFELSQILHTWKSYTSNEVNKLVGRAGQLWQVESYDHIVRDAADYVHCIQYVLANPEKAGLTDWRWVEDRTTGSLPVGSDPASTTDSLPVGSNPASTTDSLPVGSDPASTTGSLPVGSDPASTTDSLPVGSDPASTTGSLPVGSDPASTTGSLPVGSDPASTTDSLPVGSDPASTTGSLPVGPELHRLAADTTSDDVLRDAIRVPTDERLWAVAEGLRRGWSVDEINKLSRIDKWFLVKMQHLVAMEQRMVRAGESRVITGKQGLELSNLIFEAFEIGFSSPSILDTMGSGPDRKDKYAEFVRREVGRLKVMPVFKMVDTCGGEFESATPYYYGTFEEEDDAPLALSIP